MNFLEIAQSINANTTTGGTLSSVPNARGAHLRIVEWANQAWMSIQRMHHNWKFMRRPFTFDTTANLWSYPVAVALQNCPVAERTVGRWCLSDEPFRIYLTSAGQVSEVEMNAEEWIDFKRLYRFGAQALTTGFPYDVAVQDDKSLAFGPIPDGVYTVSGDYWMAPRKMELSDTAEPWMPSEFHEAIVWLAIVRYGGFEESSAIYGHANNMLSPILDALVLDQLPDIEMGAPLA